MFLERSVYLCIYLNVRDAEGEGKEEEQGEEGKKGEGKKGLGREREGEKESAFFLWFILQAVTIVGTELSRSQELLNLPGGNLAQPVLLSQIHCHEAGL